MDARSFGAAADLYDRIRPRYPHEAIRWALGNASTVVDLGAGTGILSRQLMSLGYHVTPVEPDPNMRARCDASFRKLFTSGDLLASGNSDAAGDSFAVSDSLPANRDSPVGQSATDPATEPPTARDGSAEAIPLPDSGVDAVIAGQAYHWFDPAKARPEIARVLHDGGVFAAIWNIRDESVPWVAELTNVLRQASPIAVPDGQPDTRHAGWRGPDLSDSEHFIEAERATFHHVVRHTEESLRDLMRSRSYYLTADPPRRAALEDDLSRLVTSHPDLAGRTEFDLPYVTVAYRAYRR